MHERWSSWEQILVKTVLGVYLYVVIGYSLMGRNSACLCPQTLQGFVIRHMIPGFSPAAPECRNKACYKRTNFWS